MSAPDGGSGRQWNSPDPVATSSVSGGSGGVVSGQQLINRLYQLIDRLPISECQRLQRVLEGRCQVSADDRLAPITQLYVLLPWRVNQWVVREYLHHRVLTRGRPG